MGPRSRLVLCLSAALLPAACAAGAAADMGAAADDPQADAAGAPRRRDAAALAPEAPHPETDADVASPAPAEDAAPASGPDPVDAAVAPPPEDAGPPSDDAAAAAVNGRVSLQADLQAKWVGERKTVTREGDMVVFTGAFNANEFGGPRGHTPRLPVSPGRDYQLEYRVRFDGDFPFMKGGKIPGLAGGNAPTGCVNVDPNGFSARMMWKGGGALVGYLYDQDHQGGCGEDLATGFSFKPATWYAIKERVRLNAGHNHDGAIQIWVDGRMVLDRSNREYMAEAPGNRIDSVLFHAFFGGSTQGWAPTKACSISFAEPWVTKLAD